MNPSPPPGQDLGRLIDRHISSRIQEYEAIQSQWDHPHYRVRPWSPQEKLDKALEMVNIVLALRGNGRSTSIPVPELRWSRRSGTYVRTGTKEEHVQYSPAERNAIQIFVNRELPKAIERLNHQRTLEQRRLDRLQGLQGPHLMRRRMRPSTRHQRNQPGT